MWKDEEIKEWEKKEESQDLNLAPVFWGLLLFALFVYGLIKLVAGRPYRPRPYVSQEHKIYYQRWRALTEERDRLSEQWKELDKVREELEVRGDFKEADRVRRLQSSLSSRISELGNLKSDELSKVLKELRKHGAIDRYGRRRR